MKTSNKVLITILIIIYLAIPSLLLTGLFFFVYTNAGVEVNTDITKYNDYIGKSAIEKYRNKWDMDEAIFPQTITDKMHVEDYKMVYYDPWDAQYLSYLVVEYNEYDYIDEVTRLNNYPSTSYLGYYNVTGFTKYDLLAMDADSYNGFVYALTDNVNTIIYVELIFCNYFYDLNYNEYINTDYLPDGFDATNNNSYMKLMLKNNN